jgi:hypothetical protein
MTEAPEKYSVNEVTVRKVLADAFSFRHGIHLLGSRDSGKSFFVDIAIVGSEGRERQQLEEFLGDLRESDIPDTIRVAYKDPWKTHPSSSSKSVNLIETTETHWKYRIYLIDIGSSVHDILKNESDEVYYKLLQLKVERLVSIIDKFYPRDADLLSLENRLKKKYVRK